MEELTKEQRDLLHQACMAWLCDMNYKDKMWKGATEYKQMKKKWDKQRLTIIALNNALINPAYKFEVTIL